MKKSYFLKVTEAWICKQINMKDITKDNENNESDSLRWFHLSLSPLTDSYNSSVKQAGQIGLPRNPHNWDNTTAQQLLGDS